MKKYSLSSSETRYQPGSENLVLANKLGITDPSDMDEAELVLLNKLYKRVLQENLPTGMITASMVQDWHRQWLQPVYDWAGKPRQVNLGKDHFMFAAATRVPALLQNFDRHCLAAYTPCNNHTDQQLIKAIALVHVEFILVHPFREGNGRISRLLADVMSMQAGYGTLDYSYWDSHKSQYFEAIQKGLTESYGAMETLVEMAFSKA